MQLSSPARPSSAGYPEQEVQAAAITARSAAPAFRVARVPLLIFTAIVGLTAVAGGAALILGSLSPSTGFAIVPSADYLEGSPFDSYIIPGFILAVVLGGVHIAAFVLLLRRHRRSLLGATVAGFDALIWIFVQMVWIPFSFLQPAYFAIGLAELGFTLLAFGVLRPIAGLDRPGHEPAARRAPGYPAH
jgi:hypothetical protein